MFKKPKKNFRSRKQDSDSEDEERKQHVANELPIQVPKAFLEVPCKKTKKKKEKDVLHTSNSASSVLSFDDDEVGDGETFQIKKSSHSRRHAKLLKREHRRDLEEAEKGGEDMPPSSGQYTEDFLKQLKQDQDSVNGHAPVDMELGSDVEVIPEEKPTFDLDDDDSKGNDSPKRDPFCEDRVKDLISRGQIPDAALIHRARKQRQKARERGDEYIPIDDTEKFDKNASRLIREDENDHSDEDEDRINFSVNSREQELRMMQNTFLEAEQGSHSEDSDHDEAWEQQQIQKGVRAGVSNQKEVDDATIKYQHLFFGDKPLPMPPGIVANRGNTMPSSIVATITAPPKNLPPITIEIIKKRLKDRLDDLSSVHRAHFLERNDIASRMENCDLDIDGQAGSRGGLEERYKFFQEMRGYVRDLIECLAEKTTSINYLERCMMELWRKRADKFVKRRQQDIKDQSQEYMPSKAALAQSLADTDTVEETARQRRAAEREARRARRRRAREARLISDHHDGMSTDDEENKSETNKFQMERGNIKSNCATMFDDVVEEFHDFDLVKSHFEDWKRKQGDSYEEAYIGLCLPKLFSPIIKLHLISWNPLEENCYNFEECPWFESLMFFGHEEGQLPNIDQDLKLMPSIIEKIVLIKLIAIVESLWDPLSRQQTIRLSRLIAHLVKEYPNITSESKNTQSLIKAVVQRIKKCVDDDVFMPLYPKQALDNKLSGTAQFFHRQFWSCVKLLCNIMDWQGIVSDVTIQQLGLGCLLNRYMILALQNSAVNTDSIIKCQAIVSVFPKTWFTHLESDSTIPQLEPLCRYLVNAATQLEASDKENKLVARENIKQIRKMLVTMHSMDHASGLADKFSIRS